MTFKCRENCGECCGIIPLSSELVKNNKDKFAVQPTEINAGCEDENNAWCAVITEDWSCVFLNRETKKCNIYEQRPHICRMFGPSHHPSLQCKYSKPNGNLRSLAAQKQIERRTKAMLRELSHGLCYK